MKPKKMEPLNIKEYMALTPGERNRLWEAQKLLTEALSAATSGEIAALKIERVEDICKEVTRAQWWRML